MDNRKIIIDNILDINLDNKNIEISSLSLNFSLNKYSAKKNNIWHLILNNTYLSKKDKYVIKYKCVTCDSIHNVSTTQFLRKINKCSLNCYLCRNTNLEKRNNQSLFMSLNNPNSKNESNDIILNLKDILYIRNNSINMFDSYDNDFKDNYFEYHLTDEDYNRISKNILSFHNNNLNNITNYEYWSIYKVNNQINFTSVMYDKINNTIFKPHQPILKCDNCNQCWRAKSIEKFKNSLKILCKDCSFVSKTFKLRLFHNCNNEIVLYQSQLELKFIKWCNENKFGINNGPKISYIFNDTNLTYKIDFQINDILIDIKDNHIWHQKDLISGKWNAKELATSEFLKNSIYNYYLLLDSKNWIKQLNDIKLKLENK